MHTFLKFCTLVSMVGQFLSMTICFTGSKSQDGEVLQGLVGCAPQTQHGQQPDWWGEKGVKTLQKKKTCDVTKEK